MLSTDPVVAVDNTIDNIADTIVTDPVVANGCPVFISTDTTPDETTTDPVAVETPDYTITNTTISDSVVALEETTASNTTQDPTLYVFIPIDTHIIETNPIDPLVVVDPIITIAAPLNLLSSPAKVCCMAYTASCNACAANMTVEIYCNQNPTVVGCPLA